MDYIIYTIKSHTSLYTYIFVDESPQYIYIRRYDPWLYVPSLKNLLLKLGSKNVKRVLGVWYATSKLTYKACRITYYIYTFMFFLYLPLYTYPCRRPSNLTKICRMRQKKFFSCIRIYSFLLTLSTSFNNIVIFTFYLLFIICLLYIRSLILCYFS
jgi:hypothetical protein